MEVISKIPSGEVQHTIHHTNANNRTINYAEKSIELASPYFKHGLLGLTPYSTKRQYKLSVADRLLSTENSDVHISYRMFNGQCVASYSIGNYICCLVVKLDRQELHILDPYTLRTISHIEISHSDVVLSNFVNPKELAKIRGVYVYTDRNSNIITAGSNGHIQHYSVNNGFISLVKDIDYILPDKQFTAIMPDFEDKMWFTTHEGIIGVNSANYITLNNQTIEKSLSINKDNVVFVVSDRALYAVTYNNNRIKILWTLYYESSSDISSKAIFKGSGTTPLLIGSELVVIADNASPTYNILFVDQKTGHLLSKVNTPFSLTQCSLVAYDDNSVITVNNAGYGTFMNVHVNGNLPFPGIALIDRHQGIKWVNNDIIPATALPLYCVYNDLILLYTLNKDKIWSFTALSGISGEVIYDIPIGYGPLYDNHWSPILINDLGHIMIGTLTGLISIT